MFWVQCSEECKSRIRSLLFEKVFSDLEPRILKSLSKVLTEIASCDINRGQWNDFLPQILHRCTSGIAPQREVATFVVMSFVETGIRDVTSIFPAIKCVLLLSELSAK
jgi:hypothetical protein